MLKHVNVVFSSWRSTRPRPCWTTTRSGTSPTRRRRTRSRRTATASRRVKTMTRTTIECTLTHTYIRSNPPSSPWTGPPNQLLTPQQHSRADEEQRSCAHTQNHQGQFIHTEPSSASILSFLVTWTVTSPLHFLFSTETCSFTFLLLPEENSVNTYPGLCV